MIFWIFLVLTIVSFIVCILCDKYNYEGIALVSCVGSAILFFITVVMLVALIIIYSTVYGDIEATVQRYEILEYQVEHNMYNNDNEYGKKELMDAVSGYNESIASKQGMLNNKWISIFIPDAWGQFNLIDYSDME